MSGESSTRGQRLTCGPGRGVDGVDGGKGMGMEWEIWWEDDGR